MWDDVIFAKQNLPTGHVFASITYNQLEIILKFLFHQGQIFSPQKQASATVT